MSKEKPEYEGPVEFWVALDTRVIVAARAQPDVGYWSAYIGAVRGNNHDLEYRDVIDHGSKISYRLAKVLFPILDEQFTWRD